MQQVPNEQQPEQQTDQSCSLSSRVVTPTCVAKRCVGASVFCNDKMLMLVLMTAAAMLPMPRRGRRRGACAWAALSAVAAAVAGADSVPLTLLSAPSARCLDGTLSGYYFQVCLATARDSGDT